MPTQPQQKKREKTTTIVPRSWKKRRSSKTTAYIAAQRLCIRNCKVAKGVANVRPPQSQSYCTACLCKLHTAHRQNNPRCWPDITASWSGTLNGVPRQKLAWGQLPSPHKLHPSFKVKHTATVTWPPAVFVHFTTGPSLEGRAVRVALAAACCSRRVLLPARSLGQRLSADSSTAPTYRTLESANAALYGWHTIPVQTYHIFL